MKRESAIAGKVVGLLLLASALAFAGCQSGTPLMPTPNLYAAGHFDPFANVPPELQNNHVDVLYFTDRTPDSTAAGHVQYGYGRSRSVGFGVSRVDIGKDVSWDELVKASRSATRTVKLDLGVDTTTELVRFPPTPRSFIPGKTPDAASTSDLVLLGDEQDADKQAADDAVRRELSAQLAKTPVKEVYLFVHGFNNTFDYSIETIAQLWHFFGRQGVPVAYSWPAGSKGLLRGYEYDTASSEFTVYHLKQVVRLIASCPDVHRINIICHSRGTDTTINALRELHIELHGMGKNTREVLKLGTVVLAAPDIDVDIVLQKCTTVRLGRVPERFAMYVCSQDEALGMSSWLFGGLKRLGELKANMFTPAEVNFMRDSKTMQVIDARVSRPGDFGHDYFHANPAVSSDLILLMRYQLYPGAKYGRPLRVTQNEFWAIDDGYPGNSENEPIATTEK